MSFVLSLRIALTFEAAAFFTALGRGFRAGMGRETGTNQYDANSGSEQLTRCSGLSRTDMHSTGLVRIIRTGRRIRHKLDAGLLVLFLVVFDATRGISIPATAVWHYVRRSNIDADAGVRQRQQDGNELGLECASDDRITFLADVDIEGLDEKVSPRSRATSPDLPSSRPACWTTIPSG